MVLKARPEDIAYDPRGLMVIIFIYAASGIFALSDAAETQVVVYSMMLDIAVLIIFSAACLAMLQLNARLVQTITALFGTGIIFHL